MAVSRRLRYEVLRRDDHACRYCGARAPEIKLTVDHVVPVALGGSDEPGNLVAACSACNAGKSSSAPDAPLVDAVNDDALRWGAAMRHAADIQLSDLCERREYIDEFDAKWRRFNVLGSSGDEGPLERPRDWRESIGRFFAQGLESVFLLDAVDTAMNTEKVHNHNVFRFFCGICWSLIKERQETARALVVKDEAEGPA